MSFTDADVRNGDSTTVCAVAGCHSAPTRWVSTHKRRAPERHRVCGEHERALVAADSCHCGKRASAHGLCPDHQADLHRDRRQDEAPMPTTPASDDDLQARVLDLVRQRGRSAGSLSSLLSCDRFRLRQVLLRLEAAGDVTHDGDYWRVPGEPTRRAIAAACRERGALAGDDSKPASVVEDAPASPPSKAASHGGRGGLDRSPAGRGTHSSPAPAEHAAGVAIPGRDQSLAAEGVPTSSTAEVPPPHPLPPEAPMAPTSPSTAPTTYAPRERQVLQVIFDRPGSSCQTIAAVLGVSTDNVYVLVSHLKRKGGATPLRGQDSTTTWWLTDAGEAAIAAEPAEPIPAEAIPGPVVRTTPPSQRSTTSPIADRVREDLRQHPGTTSAEIAERLGMGRANISSRLSALKKAGLVETRSGRYPGTLTQWVRYYAPGAAPDVVAAPPPPEKLFFIGTPESRSASASSPQPDVDQVGSTPPSSEPEMPVAPPSPPKASPPPATTDDLVERAEDRPATQPDALDHTAGALAQVLDYTTRALPPPTSPATLHVVPDLPPAAWTWRSRGRDLDEMALDALDAGDTQLFAALRHASAHAHVRHATASGRAS